MAKNEYKCQLQKREFMISKIKKIILLIQLIKTNQFLFKKYICYYKIEEKMNITINFKMNYIT